MHRPACLILLLLPVFFRAQSVEKISFKKELSLIYFFQKGPQSDTLVKGKNDIFYLLVPDSLKPHISILVENGRLMPAGADSLVRLDHLRSLSYESLYVKEESGSMSGIPSKSKTAWVFKSQINGVPGETITGIRLRIVDRRQDKTLLENNFLIK